MRSNHSQSRRARTCLIALAAAGVLVLSACGPRWDPSLDQLAQVSAGQVQTLPGAAAGTTTEPGAGAAPIPGQVPAGTESVAPGQPGTAAPGAAAGSGASGGGPSKPIDRGPNPGVTATSIKVCYLVPLTGAAPVPATWNKAATVYWQWRAKKGGFYGRNVEIVVKDTTSDSATALGRARECISEKAFTFITLDRFEVEAVVGRFLNGQGIPNILVQGPPRASAPDQKNTFVITIDHVVQGGLIADYFTSGDLKGKRYGVIRENVPDLLPGVNAFKDRLKQRGATVVAEEAVEGNQNDFSSTVLKFKQKDAQVVWFYGAPTQMVKLAQQAQAADYKPVWFANSISWAFDAVAAAGNKNGALDNARAFSSWVSPASPAANTYKSANQEFNPGLPPDDIGVLAWGVAEVLGAGLDSAGKDLGFNTFRAGFQSLAFAPQVWAPQRFGTGVRIGTRSVIEFRIAGDHWNQVGGFRTSF